MITALLLLIGILFPWAYGRNQAITDFEKITADGSKDSLKEAFHTNNAIKRGGSILLVCAILTAFGNSFAGLSFWLLPALILYQTAAFGYAFTSNLNRLRGLEKWYVSIQPRASKTDMFFRWCADTWNWNLGKFSRKFGIKNGHKLMLVPSNFNRFLHTAFLALSALVVIGVICFGMWINN